MTIPEILRQFQRPVQPFPLAEMRAAAKQREEITPELLRILEDAIDRAEELAEDESYMPHLYALYLLAQFRETRAYPLVIRLASLPSETLDLLVGESFVTESLGRILVSVSGGDIAPIQHLIEDEQAGDYVRMAAIGSLTILVGTGDKSREEIVAYFAELFRGKLERRPSDMWCELVACTADLYPDELFDDVKKAYDDDLIDPNFVGLDEVERDRAAGWEAMRRRLEQKPLRRPILSAIREMQGWPCFQEPRNKQPSSLADLHHMPAIRPVSSAERKIGRNEPCPCGSGKKYKKCCGG
jgi:hypothetical protein